MHRRHVVIGDIHGCFDELSELLDRIAPSDDDVVISAGDIVRKGPAPESCLELWRDRGWTAVLGNQEQKVLAGSEPLRGDLVDYIRTWPLFVELEDFAVVHGGVIPGRPLEKQRETLTSLRHIRRDGDRWMPVPKGEERPGDRFWSEVWDGPRTILYGHTPRDNARRDAKAIGLDTGCVYGGKLSAAVLDHGEWRIVSVKARRAYARQSVWKTIRRLLFG